jgi:putative tricarboxylic transport membrane protein
MGLVLIASAAGESLLKGLLAGLLGMLVTTPGLDPSAGQLRLTFGLNELTAGFNLLAVLIGVFAVSQVLSDILDPDEQPKLINVRLRDILMGPREYWQHRLNLLRSSVIGTGIGILPGVGAGIGSIVSYTVAKAFARAPQDFGKGSEEAIVASEAANNATVGGALIPVIAIGIPGSTITAILLGALVLHGIQPGPMLFARHPDLVYTIMAACLLANLVMFAVMSGAAGWIARLATVPRYILLPTILVLAVVGALAAANRLFDIWVAIGFGVLGFLMRLGGLPLAPFVIGFVLAPIAEQNLRTALMVSGGSYLPLVTRPVSLVFLLIAAVFLIWPLWRQHWSRTDANGKQL